MTGHSLSCALFIVGGDPVLGVNGGKPAALYGEAPDCALGVGGSFHHDAGIGREDGGGWIVLHGASIGWGDGCSGTVHHGAGRRAGLRS